MGIQRKETYRPERCQHEVTFYQSNWPNHKQCDRKHLPGSQFCKQHDPAAIAARRAESDKRGEIAWLKRRKEFRAEQFFDALKRIADGDNNPRETAREAIASFLDAPT